MTSFKQISCRFCFETLNDTNCEVIDNRTEKVLGVLQLNLNEESKEVMCNACSEKLSAALEFKSMCINTYNTIISYADKNVLLLDLRQVFMLENGMANVGRDQKICRLCFRIVPNEFRCINEKQLEDIQKLAPEMNIIIMKDPVMCKSCFDSLYAHNLFLKNCAEVKREIENICNHSDIKRCTETNPDLFVKNENFEEDFEINESEISIKAECVEIKSEEEEEEDSNELLASVNEKPVSSPQMEKFKHNHARMHKYKTNLNRHRLVHKRRLCEPQMYACDACTFKTDDNNAFDAHRLGHKSSLDIRRSSQQLSKLSTGKAQKKFKCNLCEYTGKYSTSVLVHKLLKHSDDPKRHKRDIQRKATNKQHHERQPKCKLSAPKQMYKCTVCTFETKNKRGLKRHELSHKDKPVSKTYKCDFCEFKTMSEKCLTVHQTSHKISWQEGIYKCTVCGFETEQRHVIAYHVLEHKITSGGGDIQFEATNKQRPENQTERKLSPPKQMYKCTVCAFETKNKRGLKRHELRHKDKPVSKTYKCDFCEFKTMFEKCLMVHQTSHKISWQGGIYKCTVCSFETEQRHVIAYHVLEHKITSGDGDIHFEATHKQRPEHQTECKLSPPKQMYKCTVCAFETKFKTGLKIHEMSHKDKPVSKTYKCDFCEFQTMFRNCLLVHQTSHKISWQEGIYKCPVCCFETEQRHVIAYHVLKHKITSEDGDIHFEATNKQRPEHQPEGKLSPPTQMYKCTVCAYETKYKQGLKRHELNHTRIGKPVPKIYKCDFCEFETIVRRNLKVHQTSHKISWQRGIYKCLVCSFETEERHVIAYHGLKHNVPSGDADEEVQVIE